MEWRDITVENREEYNQVVSHPLQSYAWGEFRKNSGVIVIRRGLFEADKLTTAFQLTIHKIPKTNWTIGYLPKSTLPTKAVIEELKKIGKEQQCISIQLEPNVIKTWNQEDRLNKQEKEIITSQFPTLKIVPAAHPLFTQYTFILDLTKSEDELLADMHSKSRYNIRVAKKHEVIVKEDNSEKAFERYWELTKETTTRQKFYAHTKRYHQLQWQTFTHIPKANELSSHLLTASYGGKTLTTLLFFVFKDTLYYPYGASSNENRNVMHSNLAMWEGILLGKKLGLKQFDMWGAMGPNPDQSDPWFGFHNFKEKFGPDHVEFIGSFDLILNPFLYQLYKVADKVRWMMLKLK